SFDRPTVVLPSDINTMRAGIFCPESSTVTLCLMASSDVKIASPMAVPSASWSLSMARFAFVRSVDGGTSNDALPANDTMPTLIFGGSWSTKAFAADCTAFNRVGFTSSASIDSDTSMATMTVARSRGIFSSCVGRANATTINAMATRNAPAAACRRQPGFLGATWSSSATFVNRTAYCWRRRCNTTYIAASATTATRNHNRMGSPNVIASHLHRRRGIDRPATQEHEAHDRPQPVVVGAQHEVVRTRTADGSGDGGALLRGSHAVALAQRRVGRLDLARRAGLRIDDVQHADVGELELAAVDDLDGHHVVTHGQAAQRHRPRRRIEPVGHDD